MAGMGGKQTFAVALLKASATVVSPGEMRGIIAQREDVGSSAVKGEQQGFATA